MDNSVRHWLGAAYKVNEPLIAQDAVPAFDLTKVVHDLSRRWNKRFGELANKLSVYFSQSVEKRSTKQLKKMLKDAGFTVEFQMTPAMRDVIGATVNQSVALIKSIPAQYFSEVEGLVMRSVQAGRDLGTLTQELHHRYGITKRRAAFIARDQNNKATAAMTRARQLEIGIREAEWRHSAGGNEPRPTHVAAGRNHERYDVAKGWYDPEVKRYVHPGELPNCKCVSSPVIDPLDFKWPGT